MMRWRLDAALRVRAGAQDRAAIALGRALGARRALEEVVARAEEAWRGATSDAPGPLLDVASLRQSGVHLLRVAADADRARRDLERARRDERSARDAWLAARRDTRAIELLRDREWMLRRRALDAAEEEELSEQGARCATRRRSPASAPASRREG